MAGKRLGKEHFDVMYSSDLKRTMDTAQAIYKHFTALNSPELIPDMRLREKGGGVLEGQPLGTPGELAKKLGISAREYKPEGGESWIDVNKRVQDFVKEIVSKYMHAKEKAVSEVPQHAEGLGPTQDSTGMMMGISGHLAVLHSH
jgi:broad specificity phosphatase PhoE